MLRRLLIPFVGSALLLAAGAGTVLGKCEGPNPPAFCSEVAVSLYAAGPGTIFHAGRVESVNISVSKSEQPFDASGVILTFARIGDTTVIRAPAATTDQPGLWRAEVRLPTGGSWTVVADVLDRAGTARQVPIQTIQVASPPAKPPAGKPVTPPVIPAMPWVLLLLVAAGIVATALIVGGSRRRARPRAPRAAVGTIVVRRAEVSPADLVAATGAEVADVTAFD